VSEDDRFTHEPSVAIELSRRKSSRPPPPPSPEVARERSDLDLVRHPIAGARRAAAPYVTMARIALTRLARDRLARAGMLMLAVVALVGILGDVLASDLPIACRWHGAVYVMPNVTRPKALAGVDCARIERERRPGDWMIAPLVAHGQAEPGNSADVLLAPLSHGHPLGTDALGRDVFARVVHGARTGLGLGLAASMVLVAIGVALGALAGFAGGIVDALVARAVEALTAVPTLLLVLVVGALVPHPTTITLVGTIALTRWTELARLVRAEVLFTLGADYVSAARALGASPVRVLWRHVLPNAIGPAIVGAAFAIAWVVLIESTIDFLRVGSPETMASWGEVMGEARTHPHAWWLVAFPGAALLATLTALNLVGEAARNALDPRLRGDDLMGV
jgi:ABC-type dipeptide/oligopeptide/nickel transport system permease subunit